MGFALAVVNRVAAEVAGAVLCGMAVVGDLLVAAVDGLWAIVDGFVFALFIGTGSSGLGAVAAAGIAGKDGEVEVEAVAKGTVPELLVATHPPLEIPSQRSPVAPLV